MSGILTDGQRESAVVLLARHLRPMSIPEWNEFEQELRILMAPDQCITLQRLPSPDGRGDAYALSITEGEFPGSATIAVTDEKLLAKLRSVKGQYVYRYKHWETPVYYYEYWTANNDSR